MAYTQTSEASEDVKGVLNNSLGNALVEVTSLSVWKMLLRQKVVGPSGSGIPNGNTLIVYVLS